MFTRSNRLSYQAMSSGRTHSQVCPAFPTSLFLQYHISLRLLNSSVTTFRLFSITFHFGYSFRQPPRLFRSKFSRDNYMSVAEWTDSYDIKQGKILWSSFGKLAQVGCEPKTTKFSSEALTHWTIRPWVQVALKANFVQLLKSHRLFSVTFLFDYCLRQSPRLF